MQTAQPLGPRPAFPNELRQGLITDLIVWFRAMELAWRSALDEPSVVGVDSRVHLTNLVIAARNVLRIGDAARDVDGVCRALEAFDEQVPNVKRVRDILEHFDDTSDAASSNNRSVYGSFNVYMR